MLQFYNNVSSVRRFKKIRRLSYSWQHQADPSEVSAAECPELAKQTIIHPPYVRWRHQNREASVGHKKLKSKRTGHRQLNHVTGLPGASCTMAGWVVNVKQSREMPTRKNNFAECLVLIPEVTRHDTSCYWAQGWRACEVLSRSKVFQLNLCHQLERA